MKLSIADADRTLRICLNTSASERTLSSRFLNEFFGTGVQHIAFPLVGDADGSTPPDLVRETADSIGGARFEIVRGAGHIPCVEQPRATADLIAGFLKEIAHA